VGAAGSASYSNEVTTVTGAGADIWGSGDELRYVYQPVTGDFQITTRVDSLSGLDGWAKAGLMVRESLNANSRMAMALVSPSFGIAYQRRVSTGGQTTSTGENGKAPIWVRIKRVGTDMEMRYSTDGTNWTWFAWDRFAGLANTVYVGMAVTAHRDGTVATGVFSNVKFG
jgi:regulation of enolase protein 1 (concanavalin A-like superfamily)